MLLAFSDATVAEPAFVRANAPSSCVRPPARPTTSRSPMRRSPRALDPLVEQHQQQGLSVARIDIEDVYDEFSFGEKTPQALRDFVRYAYANWTPRPRFLLLVGDATIDPRDYAGFGDADFVPTKQIPLDAVALETASDDWFVDVDDDGRPDMAVGRFPVRTLPQATAIVAKTIGYAMDVDAPWMNDVLFVADHDETMPGNPFEKASRRLEALLPEAYRGHELFNSRLDADLLRQMLADEVAEGRLIVNFAGHGSPYLWGIHGNLLGPDDVNGWTNSRLPFIIALNCLNGLFQGIYDEESLAEAMLRTPQGGAVAVWASSGVTDESMQTLVAEELYRLIFQGIVPTLGEMVSAAKRVGPDRDVRRSWIFFGDPALRLNGIDPQVEPDPEDPPEPDPTVLPMAPNSPTPSSGAANVPTMTALTWSASGATSYDVNFGISNPPLELATGQPDAVFTPGTLDYNTTYFWQIVAHNSVGSTTGPIWSFTTAGLPAQMTSPAPWSTVTATTIAFQWNGGIGVTNYLFRGGDNAWAAMTCTARIAGRA